MNEPKVAVVIIHWNRRALLEQFLPSLLKSSYPNIEFIVADNNSTDDSVEFLRNTYPQVRIISNDDNYGYAGGYNHALKHVDADYFVLLNNDIQVTPKWIEPVIEVMEKDKSIGACQPKMLDYNDKHRFEYAGAAGGYIDLLGYAFCRGRVFETIEEDRGQYSDERTVFWATGACLFVRADVYRQVNGFDENFFAHMEEIDLCWRMQLAGYKMKVIPHAQVYHVGGGTLNKQSSQKTYLNFRNNLIMLTKNLPVSTLLWLIPVRMTLDLLSSVFFMMNGFPSNSYAVHKAHAQYVFKFARWWKLRRQNTHFKPLGELTGVYKPSIVYQHFIRKVKSFSELRQEDFI
jgi:GT2 family glycosyltransferase